MRKSLIVLLIVSLFLPAFSYAQQNKTFHFAAGSVLADGNWFKIATAKDGVYKLTYNDLIQIGATPPFKTSDFRLFGNGGSMLPEKNAGARFDDLIENSVEVVDDGDGYINSNEYILFYGQSTMKWTFNTVSQLFAHQINYYADSTYYFFTFDKGSGKRITNYPVIANLPNIVVNTYNDHAVHELDTFNLLRSGKQWLGEAFDGLSPQYFDFVLPDICDTDNLSVKINFYAKSTVASIFKVNVDGITAFDTIVPVDGNINSENAKSDILQLNLTPNSDNIDFALTYNKPDIASIGWLNYIELNAVRKLIYRQQQILFRNTHTIGDTVAEYDFNNSGNVFQVWNVCDSGLVKEMPLTKNGNITTLKAYAQTLKEFVAFDAANAFHPGLMGAVANQNLHGMSQADLVIVTHPLFLSQANQLATFHRDNDQMNVAVATTSQIYNEFSSGKQDPSAIRDFVRMFYERNLTDSLHRVKYLLLFGDGSYDMKYRIKPNSNMIPTWQTDNSILPISSYVSDDFYGMLDSIEGDNLNGDIDVGVGRFPVSTVSDADIIVAKSIRYGIKKDELPNSYENGLISNYDSWRNNVSFIADDEDGNLHFNQTENMVILLDSITNKLNVNKIYLDSYKQVHTPSGDKYPDVNVDIDKNIRNGSLIINYVGHGGEYGLASEGVLTFTEIGKYTNFYNLPIFVTATCEFSRYDNPELTSAGEKILLHPHGGGIAMFTTTRIAFAHSNEIVNRNLIRTTFGENHTSKVRFGDIIKMSKNLCGYGVYKENFTLLGDPALSLAIPEYNVVTDKILLDTTNITGDTIYNSNVITVKGHISDKNGNLQDWFNGKIYPKVFDKPIMITTLANDPSLSYPANFYLQQGLLFQGNSTIKNGEFEFSFFAPRDIKFGQGYGKIIYYAKNNDFDARGVADSLIIKNNGINDLPDFTGPDIHIYMEDLKFKEGGETSANPLMIAFLHDTSGINAYGIGIGHEIVGILDGDGDVNNPVYLNQYFIQDSNKCTAGKVTYKFTGLSYGMHKFSLSAWDLLNNNSEKEISFNVKSPSDLDLGGVYNFPDPVIDHTTFFIERNMSTEIMYVTISIVDLSGRVCVELNQDVAPNSYKPIQIYWDGTNANGEPLSKGFYTYRVTLSDKSGKIRQKSDKMVILK